MSPHEMRLADGGCVSVSEEQHYQDVLTGIRGGVESRDVIASLELQLHGNPWARKQTGPVIEIKVDGNTVGFLTPAMSERFGRLVDAAAAQGRVLTANACVATGTGTSGRDVEITLDAVPRPAEQRSIVGLLVETHPEYVVTRDGLAHLVTSEVTAGWLVECGMPVTVTAAELVLKTTPWVGRVRSDGTLIDGWPVWCGNCRPDRARAVEDGGRFGDYTSISTRNRFSSAMTVEAITAALATRFDFDVAGESYRPGYPDKLLRFAEVLRGCRPGERLAVVLRRDPRNEYDANAIEVHIPAAGHVGFVPGELAQMLAPMLDAGHRIRAHAVEVRVRDTAPDKPGLTVSLQRSDT